LIVEGRVKASPTQRLDEIDFATRPHPARQRDRGQEAAGPAWIYRTR
jgi:hypothetical protein